MEELPRKFTVYLNTLDEKENQIVGFLIDQNGETTQARIHHYTHMPRSTLSKNVKNLLKKEILEIERYGKLNRVRLTRWFLEGDEEAENAS